MCGCHKHHAELKRKDWLDHDEILKKINLDVSANGNPTVTIDTDKNHYTIYWQQARGLFRVMDFRSGKCLTHIKLEREGCIDSENERIDIVSFFRGTRDVTEWAPHRELKIAPHDEANDCPC